MSNENNILKKALQESTKEIAEGTKIIGALYRRNAELSDALSRSSQAVDFHRDRFRWALLLALIEMIIIGGLWVYFVH